MLDIICEIYSEIHKSMYCLLCNIIYIYIKFIMLCSDYRMDYVVIGGRIIILLKSN